MPQFSYDFHIHSCLSPCGDEDMTPNNIVHMAKLLGLDIIALTDHNSCKNCRAAVRVGKEAGLMVIPGMELCTSEEAHVVCLFESVEAAEAFSDYIYANMPHIPNRPQLFGRQKVLDEQDMVLGEEPVLLVNASFLSVMELPRLVKSYSGACFPAHVDKTAYSVISSLGAIPPECGFRTVELAKAEGCQTFLQAHGLESCQVMINSDAHYLEQIAEPVHWMELSSASVGEVILSVQKGVGCVSI